MHSTRRPAPVLALEFEQGSAPRGRGFGIPACAQRASRGFRALAGALVVVAFAALAACGGGGGSSTPPPPTLTSIEIGPANPSAAAGTTEQFTATGIYSDSSKQNITSTVTWTSSSTNVATIGSAGTNAGLASALSVGSSTITASLSGVSGTTSLTVTAATLVSIQVTPASPSIAVGDTSQLTATGIYSDGSKHNVTTSVAWSSSSASIASISNTSGSNGLARGIAVGSATITAAQDGVSGTTSLTVTAATLVSIGVTPATPTIAKGTTVQLLATGVYSDGSMHDLTGSVSWSSSNSSVASVSTANGSGGLATGNAVGTAAITASFGSITGTANLTVTAATLVSIGVTSTSNSVAAGLTTQFTATGIYTDNSHQNITTAVNWASSDPSKATISNAIGYDGLATGVSPGTVTITASLNGISGTANLTVNPGTLLSIDVSAATASVATGLTDQFTATGHFTGGTTQNITDLVTWTSSDTARAVISNSAGSNGLATSTAAGTTTITAAYQGVSGSTTLTVTAATLLSLAVTPPTPSIALGTTVQFTATGTYSDTTTQNLTTLVTWGPTTGTTATVSNAAGSNGLATAVGTGTVSVTATYQGVTGSASLTVTPATLVSIGVTPANPTVAAGSTEQFNATGTYSDGSTQSLTTHVTWSSSNTGKAVISNSSNSNGLATTLAAGSVTISAAYEGVTGSTTLAITSATLASISVTGAASSVAAGLTDQFTATGNYSDGSTQNLTNSVSWSSSSPSTATINASGLASTLVQGSTTITATYQSLSGSATLTVNAATLVSIGVTPPTPSIAAGTTQLFAATGTYSDGTTATITTDVTWSSSDTSVAVISNAGGSNGLATSLVVGSTTITATYQGISGSATLTVTAAILVSISVTPASPTIALGTTLQFAATGNYSDGSTQPLTSVATWGPTSSSIATVSNANGSIGLASAGITTQGSVTVTATYAGITGSTNLTVTSASLQSVTVTAQYASVAAGTTDQFTATGNYSDGSSQNLTTSVTWSSPNAGIATISNTSPNNGFATTYAPGSVTITAVYPLVGGGSVAGTYVLTVTAATLSFIDVVPMVPTIAPNSIQQFQAIGVFTDDSTQDLTASATWSSSNAAAASISNANGSTGLATAFGASGSTTITASQGGQTGTATLTVGGAETGYLSVSGSGAIYQFTFSAGGALNYTAGGVTASSPVSVVVDPTSSYIYLGNALGGSSYVSSYAINPDGSLNSSSLGTYSIASIPVYLTIDPSDQWVYVLASSNGGTSPGGTGSIAEYTVGGGGALTANGSVAAGTDPVQIAVDPTDTFVYVATNDAGEGILGYSINPDGTLTSIGTVATITGQQIQGFAIDPTGRYLYATIAGSTGGVYEYTIGSGGALTYVGTASTGGATSIDVVVDPTGSYLYVYANANGGVITGYSIGVSGGLTLIGTVAAPDSPPHLTIDPTGEYLYAVNSNDATLGPTISEYSIGAGGALTALGASPAYYGAPGIVGDRLSFAF